MNILLKYLYERMSKFPNSLIYEENEKITYGELIKFAESHYTYFLNKKYGIVCKGAINTIKAIFCCLFSGATAVIMSDKYGKSYCQKIINKTKISFLIDDYGIKSIAPEIEEKEDISDVAYIMCTSGTTGEPKAAMITYNNILCNIKDIGKYFNINSSDTILITRPLCHASALVGELFVSLMCGANIVVNSLAYNPFMIYRTLSKEKITVFCATPTVCYQLADICSRKAERINIRKIAISGECMTKIVANKLRNTFQDSELFNVYGLTEASPRVSYLSPDMFNKNPDSVGVALDSVKLKIVDGELYVSGDNVTKGYYEDLELTKKTIQEGWLKTGDMASFDSEGLLYIKGRKDNLIIRAGINIYPQEIENVLLQDEHIKNVIAYRIKNDIAGDRIGLKVETNNLTEEEIFNICKKLLPTYQLPNVIKCVDKLPQSTNGKLIRCS